MKKQVSIGLEQEDVDRLDAARNSWTRTQFIRAAVREALDNGRKGPDNRVWFEGKWIEF